MSWPAPRRLAASPTSPGEKDAAALWALGMCATTSDSGAGRWTDAHGAARRRGRRGGRGLADDGSREKHAGAVAASCRAAGLRVVVRARDSREGDVGLPRRRPHEGELLGLAEHRSGPRPFPKFPVLPVFPAFRSRSSLRRRGRAAGVKFTDRRVSLPYATLSPVIEDVAADDGPKWSASSSSQALLDATGPT